MESLRWRRLEPPGRPGIERVRPVVRPVARTGSARQARVAIAAGAAVVALAAGLAISAGRPSGPSGTAAGDGAADTPALAAIAPDVAGRPWLVRRGDDRWVWGRTGARARTVLPEDEMGLAIAGDWLASGVSTGAGTHVRIRDLATGAVILERDAGLRVAAATFAGRRLLLTGDANGGHDDGGIVAIDVPDGGLRTLVAPGAFPARLGAVPSKGDFHVSGGGSVAAVNTCGSKSCDTTVIDLATLATSTPQRGSAGFLRAVTDEALVVTDGDGAWIKGIDVRNGRARFTLAKASLMEPASMADGRVIADVGRGDGGWQVAALGPDGVLAAITGPARAPGPWVWPAVSSAGIAVLGDVPFEAALAADTQAPNTLIRGADLRELGRLAVQPGE